MVPNQARRRQAPSACGRSCPAITVQASQGPGEKVPDGSGRLGHGHVRAPRVGSGYRVRLVASLARGATGSLYWAGRKGNSDASTRVGHPHHEPDDRGRADRGLAGGTSPVRSAKRPRGHPRRHHDRRLEGRLDNAGPGLPRRDVRGRQARPPVLSHLYGRYDCSTQTFYVLVVTIRGWAILPSNNDNYVKLGQTQKLVDGSNSRTAVHLTLPMSPRTPGRPRSISRPAAISATTA